ncbi:MAG: ROK family protein [Clostridia bacterium]|nr:ROK family protein [Clostridia bacterium]
MKNNEYLIGVDVGGTKCAVTLARSVQGQPPEILGKLKFPTEQGKPYSTLEEFMRGVDGVLAGEGLAYADIRGIGISCGGPLDAERGIVLSPPNLPAWDRIHICEYFEERTGIKCHLQNDANACAIAEWKYGAGRGYDNMAFLTFGTGLGAGLILGGRLHRGANDMAGEIGHVRLDADGPWGYGKRGSAEGFCSGGGIRQLGMAALKRCADTDEGKVLFSACGGDPERITAKMIGDLAESGDELCREIYKVSARRLGAAIAILCDVVDPQIVVIGGIYMRSKGLIEDELMRVLNEEALVPCKVVPAGLGERVGDYAALSVSTGEY